jgi:hypothetical protein
MSSDMPLTLPKTDRANSGHSAVVRIELHTAHGLFYPTHTAHECLIFREPQILEPSEARLVISIDGEPQESKVEILPHPSPNNRIPIRIV